MPGRKKSPKILPTREPTDLDVAWIAGLYEGEGTCYEGKNKSVMCGIYQKDPQILYWCQEMFGGSISVNRHKTPERECNIWNLGGDDARAFLQLIYPFMSARRKLQIDKTSFRSFTGQVKNTRPAMTEERRVSRAAMSLKEKMVESQQYWRVNNRANYLAYQHFYDAKKRGVQVESLVQETSE